MKRLTIIFAVLLTATSIMADEFKIGKLTFKVTSPTTVMLAGADEDITKVYLSETIDYQGKTYTLTSICSEAFYGCKSLTSVTIPNSVTEIGWDAFGACSSLTSITVDAGNTHYDSRNNCNAIIETATNTLIAGCKTTTIPNSVTSIGGNAFSGCTSLTSITIPNSVTTIGDFAFFDCSSLTSISIPNSVIEIRGGAFKYCSSLTSITIPNSVTEIGWGPFVGTALYNNPSIWENGALYINDCLIEVDTSFVGNFKINEKTRLIADGAFSECLSLTSVTIPNSVTSIGDYVFYGCTSLTSVTIPNSVKWIGESAFEGCKSLTSVTIPNSVTSIGEGAFYKCSAITSVTIPNSVTTIGDLAFFACSSLTSISIPNSVTSIDGFAYCSSLTSVTIPNSVTSIGDFAFAYCSSLTSVTIPDSVIDIGQEAFLGCKSLTSVIIPNSVTSIGDYAFAYCSSLASVNIPNSVKEIGGAAFKNCSSLTSITIPNSVTEIGDAAFCGCTSLRSITIPRSLMSNGKSIFCDSFDFATIHYSETESSSNNSPTYKYQKEEEPLVIRKVQLQDDGETYSVPAVEGQLVLMFGEDMSHEESTKILEENGLSIISSIPELNYYLIQVPVGEEGQYFSQLNDNDLVDYVYPNAIEYFCSASAYALDDYEYGDHGRRVSKMLTGCDSVMDKAGCDSLVNLEGKNVAFKDAWDNDKVKAASWKITEELGSILLSHFSPSTLPASSNGKVVINISIGTALENKFGEYERVLWNDDDVTESNRIDYRRSYVNDLKWYINLVKNFDDADFVIVKAASNEGMKQLETIIDELTSELTWDELKVFERHFILVSAKDDYRLVDYPNDVSRYHKMVSKVDISDVTRQDTAWRGTSFSSPRLAGYIYKLAEKYDLPATTVLRFVRSATEKAIDNVVTYELIEQEIANANRIETGFVDLGLPSGTLWKAHTETGLYTYQEANDKFVSEEENLPTYEQLFELKQECQWGRTDTGYELLGPNGNSITFSAEGYVDCGGTHHYVNGGAGIFGTETIGMIWSSTPTDADKAYSMGIGTYNAGIIQADECCYGRSVHLVKSAEKEIEKEEENVADNIITYTSSDGDIINPSANSFGATIVSNTYKNGKGTIVFDGPIIEIGDKAFSSCKSFEWYAFSNCKSLTSITIPNSVTEIGWDAFCGCSSLTSVSIPNSVTEIGFRAFKGTALYNDPSNWENGALYINDCLIEVAEGFAGHFRIKENTRVISVCAFKGCSSLTSVTIPNSVTSIGHNAFSGCSSLTSVTIPNSVTSIGGYAFRDCKSLTSVTIPNSVTSIGGYAFRDCKSLTSVTIPNSVTSIEGGMFKGSALYNDPSNWENGALYINDCLIKVDESLVGHFRIKVNTRVIAEYAFNDCSVLTSVTIPNSVTSIGEWAFYKCSSLTSVTIPNSVTSIGSWAFAGCSSLTSVTIPNSVKEIGDYAFPSHTQIIRR